MAKLGTSFTVGQLAAEVNDKVSSTDDNTILGDAVFEGKLITDKIYANDDSHTEAIEIDSVNKTVSIFGNVIGKVKAHGAISCTTKEGLNESIVGGSRIAEIPKGCIGGIAYERMENSTAINIVIQHFQDYKTPSFGLNYYSGRSTETLPLVMTDSSSSRSAQYKAYIEVDPNTHKTYFCIKSPGYDFADGYTYNLHWEVW